MAESDRVGDAHNHAGATERRMQVARIASQKYPAIPVAVCDEAIGVLRIAPDDFDLHILQASALADVPLLGVAIGQTQSR